MCVEKKGNNCVHSTDTRQMYGCVCACVQFFMFQITQWNIRNSKIVGRNEVISNNNSKINRSYINAASNECFAWLKVPFFPLQVLYFLYFLLVVLSENESFSHRILNYLTPIVPFLTYSPSVLHFFTLYPSFFRQSDLSLA